jgi:phosphoribosylformylglycinamidine synthase
MCSIQQTRRIVFKSGEVEYLDDLAVKIGRKLTDSEIFGFSQANETLPKSKIFNGKFDIDSVEKESSLLK